MSTVVLILLVLVGAVLLLAVGGFIANRRARTATAGDWAARVRAANEHLAAAHAADKGWAPDVLEEAARRAFGSEHPGAPVDELNLVQVVDRPGIEEDEAVFEIRSGGRRHELRLGRRGGAWALQRVS